ncbi:hypothetical protein [Thalassobacterium sedimentorum]|uniref:hypothetical protein n=1 Tax=Thalassobacterium sedimentorum TaxID=3041258 RepID=UPI002811C9D9|nr:hypothetical protein [Coraliomargarita sp. SDUM461004]
MLLRESLAGTENNIKFTLYPSWTIGSVASSYPQGTNPGCLVSAYHLHNIVLSVIISYIVHNAHHAVAKICDMHDAYNNETLFYQ